MSEKPTNRASLVSIFAIFVLFALFVAVVYYVYVPKKTGAFVGDGIHTASQRAANLAELRKKESEQASKYGWVDQKAGVVRLPLERAMDLTVQKYTAKP
jgi:hypothetical protein